MLDFSVSEIGLVGLVALIAIGPERLPKVARAAGVLFGRFRRYANSVKAEIENEIQKSELQGLQQRMNETARAVQQQVGHAGTEVQTLLNTPVATAEDATATAPPPALVPGFSTLPAESAPWSAASAPGLSATPFPLESMGGVTTPFGGDPFCVRGAPRRSVSMTASGKPVAEAVAYAAGPSAVAEGVDGADQPPAGSASALKVETPSP